MSGSSAVTVAEVQSSEGVYSWIYLYTTGDFHANCSDLSSDEETRFCEF
jgi:hypothetical protein